MKTPAAIGGMADSEGPLAVGNAALKSFSQPTGWPDEEKSPFKIKCFKKQTSIVTPL